jgi:hypothetical protein
MSCVFVIHQGQRRCQQTKPPFGWGFAKIAHTEGVKDGDYSPKASGFSRCEILPTSREDFPRRDKDSYRTVDVSVMAIADSGPIPLDRS